MQKIQDYKVFFEQRLSKEIYKALTSNDEQICVKREKETREHNEAYIAQQLKNVNHQNIIKYYDVCQQNGYQYYFMEYCQLTLTEYIKNRNFEVMDYLDFLLQISAGYLKLMELNIIHRDIKSDNIVVAFDEKQKPIYKIIDFGESKILSSNSSRLLTQNIGTQIYQAPEVLSSTDYDYKCDIFSLGIIIMQMIFGTQEPLTKKDWKYIKNDLQSTSVKSFIYKNSNRNVPTEILDIVDCMVTDKQWRIDWHYLSIRVSQLKAQLSPQLKMQNFINQNCNTNNQIVNPNSSMKKIFFYPNKNFKPNFKQVQYQVENKNNQQSQNQQVQEQDWGAQFQQKQEVPSQFPVHCISQANTNDQNLKSSCQEQKSKIIKSGLQKQVQQLDQEIQVGHDQISRDFQICNPLFNISIEAKNIKQNNLMFQNSSTFAQQQNISNTLKQVNNKETPLKPDNLSQILQKQRQAGDGQKSLKNKIQFSIPASNRNSQSSFQEIFLSQTLHLPSDPQKNACLQNQGQKTPQQHPNTQIKSINLKKFLQLLTDPTDTPQRSSKAVSFKTARSICQKSNLSQKLQQNIQQIVTNQKKSSLNFTQQKMNELSNNFEEVKKNREKQSKQIIRNKN